MIAGIETGGTKIVCAVADADAPTEIVETVTIPTSDPETSYLAIRELLGRHEVEAVGLASFGPVDVVPESANYGTVLASPKRGWPGFDQRAALADIVAAPLTVVSDVTGSAIGELRHGAGIGFGSIAYVTVGTGVGVGAIVAGSPVQGLGHPELGHVLVRRHPDDDFAGVCPFHGDCLEGLAAGPAVEARWGSPGSALSGEMLASAVELGAWYVAQLMMTITLSLCPERIILGGGVAKTPGLMRRVRELTAVLLNGYLQDHPAADPDSDFIVPPGLGDRAGVIGALELAAGALAPRG
ncbi:ROK family protein [Mycetocola reblochoni]|uniref:fructokinase n=2 Tax=Mycetocola reblochoni TaxID=331618 RepID=A0A1R4JVR8_9MICO|nr:ROK family protein [Mycetocola reblochoni]RLP68443.1 ROK family protein [Mycetocola reblochoni]SJN35935.1 Fructokinase [Mycetocola reblochoni REB411]